MRYIGHERLQVRKNSEFFLYRVDPLDGWPPEDSATNPRAEKSPEQREICSRPLSPIEEEKILDILSQIVG